MIDLSKQFKYSVAVVAKSSQIVVIEIYQWQFYLTIKILHDVLYIQCILLASLN